MGTRRTSSGKNSVWTVNHESISVILTFKPKISWTRSETNPQTDFGTTALNRMSICKYEPVDIQLDNTIETSVTITNFLERYYAAKHEGPERSGFGQNNESGVA